MSNSIFSEQNSYANGIERVIISNIERLSLKCKSCKEMNNCDANDFNDSRYCLSLIIAAINCKDDFEIII